MPWYPAATPQPIPWCIGMLQGEFKHIARKVTKEIASREHIKNIDNQRTAGKIRDFVKVCHCECCAMLYCVILCYALPMPCARPCYAILLTISCRMRKTTGYRQVRTKVLFHSNITTRYAFGIFLCLGSFAAHRLGLCCFGPVCEDKRRIRFLQHWVSVGPPARGGNGDVVIAPWWSSYKRTCFAASSPT